ncbi:MAG: DUF86 domain-containing protein [Firmicutes bacterium]|nr:DUF86 domain-containing protein [Bacillota bacterium]
MYNLALIDQRLGIISNCVKRLELLAGLGRDEFCRNEDAVDIAENRLRRALEALFDLGRHLVVKSGAGVPSDYRSIIDMMRDARILPDEFARRIAGMAGYRNRLIHDYSRVTPEELYEILQTRLSDFTMFSKYVIEYLGKRTDSDGNGPI